MITKTIEYFAICEEIDGWVPSKKIAEIFDTFEEARSHINDLIEDGEDKGRHKYCRPWTDEQGCSIARYFATPEMKYIKRTDDWSYKNGVLVAYSNWDKEHPYEGRFW